MHKLYERPGDNPNFLDVEAFSHDTECDHKDEVNRATFLSAYPMLPFTYYLIVGDMKAGVKW